MQIKSDNFLHITEKNNIGTTKEFNQTKGPTTSLPTTNQFPGLISSYR